MLIKNTLKNNHNIEFALLFGSYANDSSNSLSDVDIAIFTKKEFGILEIGLIISDLEQATDKKIDLVVLNDLYKTNAKLAFNISSSHKVIFCNDQKLYVDFKSNSMQYYFDIMPMYEMFDKELHKRLNNGTYGEI